MRIAVFSDSHGVKEPMLAAIKEQKPDMVLHLGDYVRDAEAIAAYFPSLDLRYVRGNCDAYSRSDAEDNLLFNADGVRIFMTHGITRREAVIAATSVGIGLGVAFEPEVFKLLPEVFRNARKWIYRGRR